jgi:arylsulfatase A-like enzyme
MRIFLFTALLITCSPAFARQPNILVLIADDLGYADVGFMGSTDVRTPHLDELRRQSIRFTSGYVSAPSCSPTRVGIMTGRYSQRLGWEFNPLRPHNGGAGMGLSVGTLTMGDRLRKAGYATGVFGKWHLGEEDAFHPNFRGFDEFYGFLWGGHDYFIGDDPEKGPIWHNREHVQLTTYLTDAIGDEACRFITTHRAQPFLAYVAFNAPHSPLEARAESIRRGGDVKRNTYIAMVEAMDTAIGRILATLHDAGLDGDTLVFFLSDNGGAISKFSPNSASNAPLRGQKGDTWEGGSRVPFLIRWTGHLPANVDDHRPISSLDILPTSLAAAGAPIPDDLDGINLLPFLTNRTSGGPHDYLFWRFGKQMAVRCGDWKLVRPSRGPGEYEDVATEPMLFNLADDIAEQHDLAAAHPDRVRQLQSAWDQWAQTLPPLRWSETINGKAVKAK